MLKVNQYCVRMLWVSRMQAVLIFVAVLLGGSPVFIDDARADNDDQTPAGSAVQPLHILIVGDSTVKEYLPGKMSASYVELRGWGQYLSDYMVDGSVRVTNLAQGGRSSKSYIVEGLWHKALNVEPKPDYVLIQFGHNEIPNKGWHRETQAGVVPEVLPGEGIGHEPMDWYRNNMRTYVATARRAGVVPVIVTAMERRSFNSRDEVRRKNLPWAEAAIAVGEAMDVSVIGLNDYSAELLNELGMDGCLFMHPTREGEVDNTHYNEHGARIYAEYVAEQLGQVVPAFSGLVSLPDVRTIEQARGAGE